MPQLCYKCGASLECKCARGVASSGAALPCPLKKGAIWVHVSDENGKNVPNYRVAVEGKTPVDTDVNGLAVFDPLDAKGYGVELGDLGAYADQYELPEHRKTLAQVENGNITYVPFVLIPLTWIAVRIWNTAGEILTGLGVSFEKTGKPAITKTLAKAELEPDGSYKLDKISSGKYQISIFDLDQDLWDIPKQPVPAGPPKLVDFKKPEDAPGSGHTVVAGDCLWSLSAKYGMPEDVIWKDSGNSALAGKYKNGFTLLPGEKVTIPKPRPKQVTRDTGLIHDFVIQDLKREMVVRFLDRGKPVRDGVTVKVRIAGKGEFDVITNGGSIRFPAPPDSTEANIDIPGLGWETYKLNLGCLAPIESAEGVKQRLTNLGYHPRASSGDPRAALVEAVRAFQKANGLSKVEPNPDNTVDQTTMDALVKACGA